MIIYSLCDIIIKNKACEDKMAKYAIIGFGCAGYYGAQAIRETDKDSDEY